MATTPIMIGAPAHAKEAGKTVGYAFYLPITAIPPTDTTTTPAAAVDVGFVGSDGVSLTSDIDAEMWQDWNLDDVIQISKGASATVECQIAGFNQDQARLLYGADSVVDGPNDTWRVVFTGELPPHIYLVFELRGAKGHGRLVCEAQVSNPGEVAFKKDEPVTHTLEAALFKNPAFKDAKGRPGYWGMYFGDGDAAP